MAKISMDLADDALAKIDAEAGGNRTAFMVAAALEAAKRARRERIDAEIALSIRENVERDAELYADWECTIRDGLEVEPPYESAHTLTRPQLPKKSIGRCRASRSCIAANLLHAARFGSYLLIRSLVWNKRKPARA